MANLDKNEYREIGELSSNRSDVVVGNIKNTNGSYKNKSLLSPDSDRLLYNYASDVNITDYAVVQESATRSEKQVFIGKNIFTIYDTESGNFYVENPRKILSKLMNPIDDGGLGLSFDDLCSVCENLKYVLSVDQLVYVFSSTLSGRKIMFAYDPYTYELTLPAHNAFEDSIGSSIIYSKPFEYNKRIHILVSKPDGLEVYMYNTFNGDYTKHVDFSNTLGSFYSAGAKTEGTIIALKEQSTNRLYFIACTNTDSVKCYNYANSRWEVVTDANLSLSSRSIVQCAIYDAAYTNRTKISILVDNNAIYFLGTTDESSSISVTRTKYSFTRTYGVTAFIKCLVSSDNYGFYFIVKRSDGSSTTVYEDQTYIVSDKTIDVADYIFNQESPAFIKSISDNVCINGNAFSTDKTNLIYGSYKEAGNTLPLIKDFGVTSRNLPDIEENRMFRTVDSKDSGIALTKGASYGDSQMARVRLYPESILVESSVSVPDSTPVTLRESDSDKTEYTTGSYIWKVLKSTGMPYNTHVEAVGRIVIDGYDIPIEKAMITRASSGETFGDVLFTFDKMYDIMKIKDNLSDGISSYPGVLFFKNNGFLQNALISNSHVLNGSLFYDDSSNGRLFDSGIVSIVCSCRLDDGNILLGTNFGAIASVNIQTGGYRSINGDASGDNPPPYFRGMDDYSTYGCIVGIVNHKNKIFAIYSSGAVFKTEVGSNSWVNVKPIDTDEDITWKKAYVQHDNLLIVSKNHGKLYRMDLDTETYIDDTSATKSIDAVASTDPCCQVQLGHRVYYLPLTWRTTNNPFSLNHLYWFDANVCIFGKDDSVEFEQGAMLMTDGRYVYAISDRSGTSKTFLRYDPETSEVKRLADLPTSNLTRSGGFYKNDKLYIPFGMIDTVWHLLEYNTINDTWIAHNVDIDNNSVNVDANYLIWKSPKGERIFSQIYGLNNISNRNKTISYGILADYTMSINIDALQIEKTVNIVGGQSRYYGAMLTYDDVNRNITLFGGTKYVTSTTTEDHRKKVEIYNIDTVSLVKSFNLLAGINALSPISFAKNSYVYCTSRLTDNARDNVACIEMRLNGDFSVSCNNFTLTEYDTESVWYDKPISSMYLECQNSNTSDRRLLVISYCDGTVATMNASLFRHLNTTFIQSNHPTTGHYTVQKYPPRSRKAILAAAGEVSFDGATSIKKIGDDIYFYTPSHTFRWSTLVGAWFHKGCGDDRDLEKADTRVTDLKPWSLYTKKHIAGSSKCMVGKYIVFCNGYDPTKSLMPSKTNIPGRHIVAYDTEFDEFSVIAEAKNDSDISGTVYKKSNAYAYYRDGYIYQLGGNKWSTEYINTSGTTDTLETPTIKVERYDLVTGTSINTESYDRNLSFCDALRLINNLYYPVYTNSNIKYLTDMSITSRCSLSKLYTVDLSDDAIYKDRYRVHISTGFNRMEYNSVPTNNGSNIQVSSFHGAHVLSGTTGAAASIVQSCIRLSVYDTYTESRKVYFDETDANISYITDPTKWYKGNVSGGTIYDVLKVNVPAICVERYKGDGNICELYTIQENKLYLLKLESDPTAKGKETTSIFYKKKISCTLVSTAPYDIVTKQSVCEPFYDEELDAIVVEGVYKDRSTLEKVTMIYSFETNEWKEIRNLNSGLFTPDTNTTPLNRLMPHLEDDKGNLYYVDDINYIVKKEKRSDIVAAYNEDIPITPMFELFMSGVEDSSIPNAVKSTQIVSLGNCFYKGVLIYKGNTDYDSDPSLGTKGKTRFVVLKFDSVTREISVAGIDYPTGTWTAKTNNPIVKAIVCNDMVWFLPKLGTVTGETTSSIPSIAYSFNPDDLTLAKHNIEGEDIPSGIPNSSIISDDANKCAHVLYCTGGNATEGYGLKDLRLSGLTKLSHIDSSAIGLDIVSEKEPSTIDKKAIPYGSIDYETGEMQIVVQTLHKTDSGVSSIAGVKYIKIGDDGLLFNDGDEITTGLIYNVSPYKGSHDVETDLGTIYIAGDKIVTQHAGPKFRVYNKAFETLALYSHKSTSDSGTTYTYPRNVMFTQDKVIFVENVSANSAKVSMYDINPIPEYKEIKNVNNTVNCTEYVSAVSQTNLVITNDDVLCRVDDQTALLYSNTTNKLYHFDINNKVLRTLMDFSNSGYGKVLTMCSNGKEIAIINSSRLYLIDIDRKYVYSDIAIPGGSRASCMNDTTIFIYSDTTNKVASYDLTTFRLLSEVNVDPVDAKHTVIEYEEKTDTIYLIMQDTSDVFIRYKIRDGFVIDVKSQSYIEVGTAPVVYDGFYYDSGELIVYRPYTPSSGLKTFGITTVDIETMLSVGHSTGTTSITSFVDNVVEYDSSVVRNLPEHSVSLVSGRFKIIGYSDRSEILYNKKLVNSIDSVRYIDQNKTMVFEFGEKLFSLEDSKIMLNGDIYIDLSSVLTGRVEYIYTEASGKIKILTSILVDSTTVSFGITVCDISNKTIVSSESIDAIGFSNLTASYTVSSEPLMSGSMIILSIICNSQDASSRYPYSVSIDMRTLVANVTPTSSAPEAIKSLKGADKIQFIGEDILSAGGYTVESQTVDSMPTFAGANSYTKKPLVDSIEDNGSLSIQDMTHAALLKSGSRLISVSSGNREVHYDRSGNSVAKQTSILYAAPYSTGMLHSNNGQLVTHEHFTLKADTVEKARNVPRYMPLENDVFVVKDVSGPYRAIRIPKSPITEFIHGDYGIKIYSGSTSDLFVTYNLETKEIVDRLQTERGYGLSITDVNVSDDVTLIFYENSPNISSLLIHDNGTITVKLFDGRVLGREIGDTDNDLSVQELDLTLLFDAESSEYGMRS